MSSSSLQTHVCAYEYFQSLGIYQRPILENDRFIAFVIGDSMDPVTSQIMEKFALPIGFQQFIPRF
jgi:hypothetical protein